METFPLYSRSFEEAKELQFKIVDCATKVFNGNDALSIGDLGVHKGTNEPLQTIRVEKILARAFDAEDAVLVRGAGTGALRWALAATIKPGSTILVHDAPIYPTTKVTLELMGCTAVYADFNNLEQTKRVIEEAKGLSAVLIQHSRQKPDDSYDLGQVIRVVRDANPGLPIVVDDNYAVTKVMKIGWQAGADLSAFSSFKLLGPEGVGIVLGVKDYISAIRKMQYSGGSQVQGSEAMEVLRGLIYAPVALSITGATCHELADRLNAKEIPHVVQAFVANSESKAVLIEFDEDIAEKVLELAPVYGAAPHPVGCESKYEFLPMFYRISATFREANSAWEHRMIRVNVMRSGADTVIRILKELLDEIYS